MADSLFFETIGPLTVADAVAIAGAQLHSGGGDDEISAASDIAASDLGGAVVFATRPEQIRALTNKSPALCLTTAALASEVAAVGAVALCKNPRAAFGLICARLYRSRQAGERMRDFAAGVRVHETAFVDRSASLGEGTSVGPNAVIGPGVIIGANSTIFAGAKISHAKIGEKARIHSGAVIGQDGFGFEAVEGGIVRIPQLGRVLIGDDVDVGANSTIDRGALGDTVLGHHVKIDNQVQIGHNVQIGDFTVIAAQTGISGSCIIGKGVLMGGMTGVGDHITIGDGARLAGGSGVMNDVPAGAKWGGTPARPMRTWLREVATLAKLAKKSR